MSKTDTASLELTTEDVRLLQKGLTALRAVLSVAHQPIPNRLDHLHRQLYHLASANGESRPQHNTMSAREVADLLNVTLQQVCQLGGKSRLDIAKKGQRGRGHSTLYTTESVKRYAENRPRPGRQSRTSSTKDSF